MYNPIYMARKLNSIKYYIPTSVANLIITGAQINSFLQTNHGLHNNTTLDAIITVLAAVGGAGGIYLSLSKKARNEIGEVFRNHPLTDKKYIAFLGPNPMTLVNHMAKELEKEVTEGHNLAELFQELQQDAYKNSTELIEKD